MPLFVWLRCVILNMTCRNILWVVILLGPYQKRSKFTLKWNPNSIGMLPIVGQISCLIQTLRKHLFYNVALGCINKNKVMSGRFKEVVQTQSRRQFQSKRCHRGQLADSHWTGKMAGYLIEEKQKNRQLLCLREQPDNCEMICCFLKLNSTFLTLEQPFRL